MHRLLMKKRKKGFVMIAAAFAVTSLAGITGLAVDLGRVYIVKNELQTYSDAAALAAALELNGKDTGIAAAQTAAREMPDQWNFSSQSLTSDQVTVEFASAPTGATWYATPASGDVASMTNVRVTASVQMKLYLIPAVKADSYSNVRARSTAGKVTATEIGAGNVLPFSPIAPNAAAADFGFAKGGSYALRWASNFDDSGAPASGSVCSGDRALGWDTGSTIAAARAGASSTRGYWGSESSNDIDEWITHGYDHPLTIGCIIGMADGIKNGRKETMEDRVTSDTDTTSATFATYEANRANGSRRGNGRRVIAVPINNGTVAASATSGSDPNGNGHTSGHGPNSLESRTVIGFAAFFMSDTSYDDTVGNEPFCAEYVGSYTVGANAHSGGGTDTITKVRLVR